MKKLTSLALLMSVMTLSVLTYTKWYTIYPPIKVCDYTDINHTQKKELRFRLVELLRDIKINHS